MIKMVVSDVDGTLLGKAGNLSNKNIEAIQLLEKNHVQFVIASGRDYHGVHSIIDKYNISCEAILGNGAQYVDEKGNELKNCYLNKELLKDIVSIFTNRNIPFMVFTTKGFYTCYKPVFVSEAYIERGILRFNAKRDMFDETYPCMQLQEIKDIDTFIKEDLNILKVEAFSLDVDKIIESKEILKDISGISYLSSFNDNVEVTDKYAQKGLILKEIVKLKGLKKEEVAVIGDGMNDITMFQNFNYSYAVENAEEPIKDLAYKIVDSHLEDGFSQAVKDILEIK